MNKEQQSTFIMIATILIVSIITFIAIFNIIWGIVAEPLNSAISSISYFVRTQNGDYNFNIPASSNNQNSEILIIEDNQPIGTVVENIVEEQQSSPIINNINADNTNLSTADDSNSDTIALADIEINYDFVIPRINTNNAAVNFQSFSDAILTDAVLAGYGSGSDTPQVNLQIIIPKIGINSAVLQGLGADDLLERGFWSYPGSNELGKGEVVMLCHRRFFGPYDPRSCWFLDKMTKGDEIIMKYAGNDLRYEVVGVNVFDAEDPLIYSISDSEDYIKLVTCTPLYSNIQRLVVLAKRAK